MVNFIGPMEKFIKENGRMVKSAALVHMNLVMETAMKAISLKEKGTAKEFIAGITNVFTTVVGRKTE